MLEILLSTMSTWLTKDNKVKRLLPIFVLTFIIIGVAYQWLKPNDYLATMEIKTIPSIFGATLSTYSQTLENSDMEALKNDRFKQIMRSNDSVFIYDYSIERVNDSISKATVRIDLESSSLLLRLKILLQDTDFEKRVRSTLFDFNGKLKEHLESFRVKIDGYAEIEDQYCACVSLETDQLQKAQGMMKNYSLLGQFLLQNKLQPVGEPFVQITHWDREKNLIKYDFCYPLDSDTQMIPHELISFKTRKKFKALKAVYNGNYISSDRAWYYLLDHAGKHEITLLEQPLEIFYNNPNMGGNSLDWKAEVFMPLAE